MAIKRKKGWEIPESSATPEAAFFARRRVLVGGIAGAAAVGAGAGLWMFGGHGTGESNATEAQIAQAPAPAADPSAGLYPAMRNMRYRLDRDITDEKVATTYNNFYEFGSSKTIWQAAQKLPIRPWEIKIDGMVEKPRTVGIDDLLKAMKLEERLYRHRCVEAWAMAVPWTGFPMKDFVAFAAPLSSAKYVRMETFLDAAVAPGQKAGWYPWPYVEGLTIDEATNDLTLLATGIYGKPIPKQMGAPLRLVVPWKYGFKSVKSIVRFNFTDAAAEDVLGGDPGFRVRVLGQRESESLASALEPGERGADRHRRHPGPDADLQRLWGFRRPALHRPAERAPLGLGRP